MFALAKSGQGVFIQLMLIWVLKEQRLFLLMKTGLMSIMPLKNKLMTLSWIITQQESILL